MYTLHKKVLAIRRGANLSDTRSIALKMLRIVTALTVPNLSDAALSRAVATLSHLTATE